MPPRGKKGRGTFEITRAGSLAIEGGPKSLFLCRIGKTRGKGSRILSEKGLVGMSAAASIQQISLVGAIGGKIPYCCFLRGGKRGKGKRFL